MKKCKKINGLEICRKNTAVVKKVIIRAIRDFKITYPRVGKFAFIFVGSAGRGEVCYGSDIDYLIVHNKKLKQKEINLIIKKVSDNIKNAGFNKISKFATGDKKFIINCGKYSLIDRLALEDISFVAGDKGLYRTLKKAINRSFWGLNQKELDDTLLNLLFIYRRFYKFPDFSSPEPNVKKGKGGIREIQNFIQIAKIKYGIKENKLVKIIDKMGRKRAISEKEAKSFTKAARFIFAVRNHLHRLDREKRENENEQLTEEFQEKISKIFGFSNKNAFKKEYKKHGRCVRNVVKKLKRKIRKEIEGRKGKAWSEVFKKAEKTNQKKEIYEKLLKEKDDSIKLAVVWNCHYGDILEKVFDSCFTENNRNWNIMFAFAYSPYSSPHIFKKLLQLKNKGNAYRMIPREVASNNKVPLEILATITKENGFDSHIVEKAENNILHRKKH